MKKWIAAILLSFAIGYGLCYYFQEPRIVTITQTEIVTNTIARNISDMSVEQLRKEIECYYTSPPLLDIKYLSGDNFLLSAELCERKWQKHANIKIPAKKYSHLVAGGIFFDSEMNPGVYSQYYKLYGRIGFGGGIAFSPGYLQVMAGGVILW